MDCLRECLAALLVLTLVSLPFGPPSFSFESFCLLPASGFILLFLGFVPSSVALFTSLQFLASSAEGSLFVCPLHSACFLACLVVFHFLFCVLVQDLFFFLIKDSSALDSFCGC